MTLALRYLYSILMALRAPRITLLEESVISLRAWPWDLDLNLHVNNGRYLSLMDLGRMDLLVRVGLLRAVLRDGWRPVLGAARIRFRRSIRPFQPFRLRTRLLWWDEKWFYMEQTFEVEGRAVAAGVVQGLLRGPAGNLPPEEVLAAAGLAHLERPAPPADLHRWPG